MADETVIATRSLAKHYRDVRAVDGLTVEVRRGEVYGFLGRNGAGKTTTIRMLLGLIRPTAGEVELFGRRGPRSGAAAFAKIGYLVETATAYPNLTVFENLEIQRRLTGSPHSAIGKVIGLLHLDEYADRTAGTLSLGNKQLLSLARALLHSPEVGAKAQFAARSADWPSFAAVLAQMTGVGGMVLTAVITTYVFGRGYAEGTAKNMLALPVRRESFVIAKLLAATGWGKWFPYSIVALYTGIGGPRVTVLEPGSYVVVLLVFAAGLAATVWQVRSADDTQ